MSKKYTPTFTYTIEIDTEKYQKDRLEKRLNAARILYNQVLGYGIEGLKKLRKDERYKKYLQEKNYKKLDELKEGYGLTKTKFEEFLKPKRYKYQQLIGSNVGQKIAFKAFQAVSADMYKLRGKPRFKGYGRVRSIEGKANTGGIRFKGGRFFINKEEFSLKYEKSEKLKAYEEYALSKPLKYCRIVRKEIRGEYRYYLQLILEGVPYFKPERKCGNEIVGLDLGPQTLAITTKKYARLQIFASELERENKLEGRIQRKINRKKRLLNPENFEGKKLKKGKHKWKRSKKLKKLESQYRDLKRKNKEKRKELHGRLIKELLELGVNFKIEKINYKAWQKLFGKSIGAKAPGLFIELLRRKAESAGGGVYEFSTFQTKLSQTCVCGRVKKKSLSERLHICECGVKIQRDLLSSYLGLFVENDQLDIGSACKHYPRFEQPSRAAIHNLLDSRLPLATFGLLKSELENQLLEL